MSVTNPDDTVAVLTATGDRRSLRIRSDKTKVIISTDVFEDLPLFVLTPEVATRMASLLTEVVAALERKSQ